MCISWNNKKVFWCCWCTVQTRRLKRSSVNSNSHNKGTVFSEKIPCVHKKNLSTLSKNTSKAFSRCSVHFTCNMEADGSSELLANFHYNIWRHKPEARVFFFQCNVKVHSDERDLAQGNCKNGKKLGRNIFVYTYPLSSKLYSGFYTYVTHSMPEA